MTWFDILVAANVKRYQRDVEQTSTPHKAHENKSVIDRRRVRLFCTADPFYKLKSRLKLLAQQRRLNLKIQNTQSWRNTAGKLAQT